MPPLLPRNDKISDFARLALNCDLERARHAERTDFLHAFKRLNFQQQTLDATQTDLDRRAQSKPLDPYFFLLGLYRARRRDIWTLHCLQCGQKFSAGGRHACRQRYYGFQEKLQNKGFTNVRLEYLKWYHKVYVVAFNNEIMELCSSKKQKRVNQTETHNDGMELSEVEEGEIVE